MLLLATHTVNENTNKTSINWLAGVKFRTLDLRSRDAEFNYGSVRYQVVTTWIDECLREINYLGI